MLDENIDERITNQQAAIEQEVRISSLKAHNL